MTKKESNDITLEYYFHSEQKMFLNNILKINDESLLEIRLISESNPSIRQFFSDTDKACEYISKHRKLSNIYFGIASRKDNTSGEKSNCNELGALFIDIDCGSKGHKKGSIFNTKEVALQFINQIEFFKPSIIVDSGNGYHLYWLLEMAVRLDDKKQVDFLEKSMKNLSAIFGGDSTYDVSRIFRVPETLNFKSEDPAICTIVESDYNKRYSLLELSNHPFMQIEYSIIKSDQSKHNYYGLLFGDTTGFKTNDRSEIDQSLITFLVKEGYSDEEIKLLFMNYPTTGKFSEHNDPVKYLEHSITNAREFLENSLNNLKKQEYHRDPDDERFRIKRDKAMFGYHLADNDGIEHRLTNFLMELHPRTQMKRNQETLSFYSGLIKFPDKVYEFDKFTSSLLVEPTQFAKFVANHTGTEGVIYKSHALSAIKYFNRNAGVRYEREYGFTPDLDRFITGTMIITKDQIINQDTPIKNIEHLGDNTLDLINDPKRAKIARAGLLDILGKWDKPQRINPIVAYIFYSLIHPFIKNVCPKKFYLLIQGTSGSGKTVTLMWCQKFYGKFDSITPWNSTYAAIYNIGSAYRHCMLAIDDLKRQNFKNESELKQASIVLQNFADYHSRKRSNKAMGAMDDHKIEGSLMITGEDIVFTEASTIARGIVVNVDTRETNFNFVNKINDQSNHFPALTLEFIQYLLGKLSQDNIVEIFKICRKIIDQHYSASYDKVDINNYDREANNFASLLTSWIILKSFLWESDPINEEIILNDFNEYFLDLMNTNLSLVKELRSDDLFENLLWDSIESGKLHLSEVDLYGREPYKDNRIIYIGHFHRGRDKNVSVYISLPTALQELKRINPDIMVHQSTLISKLEAEGKIERCARNKKWSICGLQVRGIKWIGKIPESVFNIPEMIVKPQDPQPITSGKDEPSSQELKNEKLDINEESNGNIELVSCDYEEHGVTAGDPPSWDELVAKYLDLVEKNNDEEENTDENI